MTLSLFDDAPPVDPLPVNTAPWKQAKRVTLYHGDNLPILRAMPSKSVDACVSDPPYGLGYMGREWDTFDPDKARDTKAFAIGHGENKARKDSANPNLRGRRQSPAMSPSQIEYDRTLEGQWRFQEWCQEWAREVWRVLKPGGHLLSCGAPRSAHRMVCGIENAGFEIRDSIAWLFGQGFPKSMNLDGDFDGWGTALKPGHEPICVARKPFDGTIEENVVRWGVGALNIDRCRLDEDGEHSESCGYALYGLPAICTCGVGIGRWPPNVAVDEAVAEQLRQRSRFFFCPKPSRRERDFGCDALPMKTPGECTDRKEGSAGITPYAGAGRSGGGRNPHPTVKPVHLMRWLLWLVTPPEGVVLDLFLGSGTTGVAAVVDGYRFIGIEKELEYLITADARIEASA